MSALIWPRLKGRPLCIIAAKWYLKLLRAILGPKIGSKSYNLSVVFPSWEFRGSLFRIACTRFVDVNKRIIISLNCNIVDLIVLAKNNFSLWVKPLPTIVKLHRVTRQKTAVYFFDENLGRNSESLQSSFKANDGENGILKYRYKTDLQAARLSIWHDRKVVYRILILVRFHKESV